MLRRIAARTFVIVAVVVIVLVMFAFTWRNKVPLDVDLFFVSVPTTAAVAFTVAFAVGWLFGIMCLGAWALKLLNERRSLRRKLKVSESEVTTLRNLPLNDAD
ncbi:MAG: hypothetical protein R3358_12875 [Woeseiaceae bacterium]|nr:hypothetical protein [Woeseiaceae bacterium]